MSDHNQRVPYVRAYMHGGIVNGVLSILGFIAGTSLAQGVMTLFILSGLGVVWILKYHLGVYGQYKALDDAEISKPTSVG